MSFFIVFCIGTRATTKNRIRYTPFCVGLPHETDENEAAALARREDHAPGGPTIIIL